MTNQWGEFPDARIDELNPGLDYKNEAAFCEFGEDLKHSLDPDRCYNPAQHSRRQKTVKQSGARAAETIH